MEFWSEENLRISRKLECDDPIRLDLDLCRMLDIDIAFVDDYAVFVNGDLFETNSNMRVCKNRALYTFWSDRMSFLANLIKQAAAEVVESFLLPGSTMFDKLERLRQQMQGCQEIIDSLDGELEDMEEYNGKR